MNPYRVYTIILILSVCLVFINKHVEFCMFLWEGSLILFLDMEFLLEKMNTVNLNYIFSPSVMNESTILSSSEGVPYCKLRILKHHTTLIQEPSQGVTFCN